DQHAAHERVLYEQFLEQYMTQRIEVQQLLQGEVLECTPTERMLIIEHKMALEQLGFRVEDFGQNTFVVKSVPLILGRQQPQAMVYEIIALLREGKQKLQDRKEEIITRMACRAAVMAGDTLTNIQMEDIVRDLATKKDPYTCPHGRPTMIKTQAEELEKKFKRK
ncbi:TPA: DNA mismatch repair protein MutL, partial [Candidatus Woesearchaeota archaeon]|nr:DNA mismatch repair protein MutL [Candidatus Woesearchaeota archaeon]